MKNFKVILLHEISQQIKSYRFFLTLVLAILISLACTYMQVNDLEDRQDTYMEAVSQASGLAENFKTYSDVVIPILIAPNPLSIFAKGYDELAGNRVDISIPDLPELKTDEQKTNPFLAIFSNFDVVTIISIILSVMTLFMVSDSISGERESDMLKMVFANNVKRSQYFMAKYLGSMAILTIPLISVFIVALLFFQCRPGISLSPSDLGRIGLMFISCIFFISLFALLGLTVSAISKSGAMSILGGLIIWVLMVMIYPNTIDFIVSKVVSIPSTDELETNLNQLAKERDEIFEENNKQIGQPIGWSCSNCWDGTGYWRRLYVANKGLFVSAEKQIALNMPVYLDYQKKELEVRDAYQQKLYHQKRFAGYLKFMLPGYLLENAAAKISTTDFQTRIIKLQKEARFYRNRVLDYLKDKGAFGWRFYTQMPEELMQENYRDYDKEVMDRYTNHLEPLDIIDKPEFHQNRLFSVPVELGVMLLLNVLFFLAGSRLFIRSPLIS